MLTSTHLHLHPLINVLLESLPKAHRDKLINAICGPGLLSALNGVRLAEPGAVSIENPFNGIDDLTYLHLLGGEVANSLQRYVDILTEISMLSNRAEGPLAGSGEAAIL